MEVKFRATKEEAATISKIVKRACNINNSLDALTLSMDLEACHSNGNPLDFDRMLAADDFNLMHDVYGISRHIDRENGELTDLFSPRFSKKIIESIPGGEPNRFKIA